MKYFPPTRSRYFLMTPPRSLYFLYPISGSWGVGSHVPSPLRHVRYDRGLRVSDFGEIADVAKVEGPENSIGRPLLGTNVWICRPRPEDADGDQGGGDEAALVHAERDAGSSGPTMGEVVISGAQVDAMSSYLNSAELTSRVFVQCRGEGECLGKDSYYY